jgi:hypothetical protein
MYLRADLACANPYQVRLKARLRQIPAPGEKDLASIFAIANWWVKIPYKYIVKKSPMRRTSKNFVKFDNKA